VFLGGRSSDDILCVKDFESAGITVHITTEDGSMGTRGLITDLLEPFLRASDVGPRTVFTCGPPGMLAAVARLAEKHGIACQASVEANMACGFGACMGCAIEVRSNGAGPTYKLVCKDGPVFDSRELVWG
jgi:dihydroorotate dehydrogenase electron transfer subunit